MTPETIEAVRAAIAATLRTATGWVCDSCDSVLRETADRVAADSDPSDWWSCPVCEEVECDAGCPLEAIRSAGER